MDLRYFYIRTASATRLVISDARAEEITSSVHGQLALGRYDEAMTDAVQSVQEILSQVHASEPSWLWPALLGCGLTVLSSLLASLPNVSYERALKGSRDKWALNLQLTAWTLLWVLAMRACGPGSGFRSLGAAEGGGLAGLFQGAGQLADELGRVAQRAQPGPPEEPEDGVIELLVAPRGQRAQLPQDLHRLLDVRRTFL